MGTVYNFITEPGKLSKSEEGFDLDYMDDRMESTGFSSYIGISRYYDEYVEYLCKKLSKLPASAVKGLAGYMDMYYSSYWYNQDFRPEVFDGSFQSTLEVGITGLDEDNIELTADFWYGEGSNFDERCIFSKKNFFEKNIPSGLTPFVDVVNSMLSLFNGKNIDIERVTLYLVSNLAVDLENPVNTGTFSYFMGISRVFEDHWNPDDPLTSDTYEVALIAVPDKTSCVIKKKDYYERLLSFIKDGISGWIWTQGCNVWSDTADGGYLVPYDFGGEGTVAVYPSDTPEKIIEREMSIIKKGG